MHLDYANGTRSFDFRGDMQGAYDQVARQFGVDVAFDVDLRATAGALQSRRRGFPDGDAAAGRHDRHILASAGEASVFCERRTRSRKEEDYAESAVRTVALPSSETPEQMTETLRVVRDIAGITRANLDTNSRTITLRASPQTVAVASGLIDDLQKPTGELILEMEVLEVDRDYARNLGITPPQSTQIYSLNSQQIQEAQQSVQGLVNVITQVFGQPSSLSGLSGEPDHLAC